MKGAFLINDKTILKAALDFAVALGLSVDKDNYDREAGEAIAVGTSKKYVVSGNERAAYYPEKKGVNLLVLDTNFSDFVTAVLSHYVPNTTTSTTTTTKTVEILDFYSTEADYGLDGKYNNDAIYLLVSKVKKLGKNPADYYVIDEDGHYGEYSLTTDSDSDNIGNLAAIFAEIQ